MIPRASGFLVLLFLSVFSGARISFAEDVVISSGEHEDFSRLVLRFPERVEWQFGRVTDGYEFRAVSTGTNYELRNVFKLIPRDRIKDVRDLGDGRLFIAVDCECFGDAFDLRGGEVALDIKDGKPLAAAQIFNVALPDLLDASHEPQSNTSMPAIELQMSDHGQAHASDASVLSLGTAEIPSFSTEIAEQAAARGGLNLRQARQGLPLFLIPDGGEGAQVDTTKNEEIEASNETDHAPMQSGQSTEGGMEEVSSADHNIDIPTSQRVAETEAALLEQIGRAAAQGLLEPNIAETREHIRQANAPLTQVPDANAAVLEISVTQPEAPSGPEAHVSIQTAIDRVANSKTPDATTATGLECPPDRLFDISSWGSDTGGISQIGAYRTGILGEFDSVNPEAILALAHHFLYLTFGAETEALIRQFEPDIERTDILLILAEIMDTQHSPRGQVLERYLSCPGKVAIWAALSQQEFRAGGEINTKAITAAFSAFPVHLRRYLGPPLAERLVNAGEMQAAISLRNAIDRVEGDPGPGVGYLDAQMALGRKDIDGAIAGLKETVISDADVAPSAILKLIELKLEQNIAITDHEIANAATHAFENRGSDMGNALARAQIKALAQSVRFAEAFTRLSVLKERHETPPGELQETRIFVVSKMTENASDAVFLRFMLSQEQQIQLPRDVRIQAASRLVDLGFNHDAREVLERSASVPDVQERRLFAQIAVAEEKFDIALGYLSGLEETQDILLRAQALDGKQDLIGAAQMFGRAGENDGQLSASWRAGDWANISNSDHGVASQASQLMMRQEMVQADADIAAISLQSSSALLTQAEGTRDIVSRLLSEFSLP